MAEFLYYNPGPIIEALQTMPTAPKMLSRTDGSQLAYVHHQGSSPGVVFCSGFHSDMNGGKALALDAFCRANKIQFTRFDYFGHGQSSGRIENGSIGRWLSDTVAVLEQITDGPQIIVGSSMGGWLMLLAAMACPQRIQALVGIAVAADYTEDMRQRRLGPVQTRQLRQYGCCDLPNKYDDQEPYRISQALLDEAQQHLLLHREEIPIDVPVRLLHGMLDEDVPWQKSLQVIDKLRGADVELLLMKTGDHRLSSPRCLETLCATIGRLIGVTPGESSEHSVHSDREMPTDA